MINVLIVDYEQLYVNKLENLGEIDAFLKKILKVVQRKTEN